MSEEIETKAFLPILLARIGRYQDSLTTLKEYKVGDESFTRQMLSCQILCVANVVDGDRKALLSLREFINSGSAKGTELSLMTNYANALEFRLKSRINEQIELLTSLLNQNMANDSQIKSVLFKELAESHKLTFELNNNDSEAKDKAISCYKSAIECISNHKEEAIAQYLSTVYSQQSFAFEHSSNKEEVLQSLKTEFESALNTIDDLKLKSYDEVTQLLFSIKRTLKEWTKKCKNR